MINKFLCCIPARGGSKRLPGKNLLPLAGKPMIAYSIETALASDLIEDVYVCTEDRTIAEVASDCGARIPMLVPPELCGDLVPAHVPCQLMAKFLSEQGQEKDILVCLQPTSPLRSLGDLEAGLERFLQGDLDFLVSVTPIDPHYFHWAIVPESNGYWRMYFYDEYMRERPLLPTVYRPNGSIKIARLEKLQELGHFFGPRLGIVETPEERSVHVGTRFDFEICEFLLRRQTA
jgi:CMP-N,N'-diacetyllegionaminic acid synthase